jgi:rhombotail lipoprotein
MLRNLFVLLLVVGLVGLTSGCAGFLKLDGRQAQSSSLVAYLYPGGERPDHAHDDLPQVELPARVGLAFVPSRQAPVGLSGAERERLLAEVRRSFLRQPFIGRIEIIPEGYLQVGGGWDNLDQVAQLFGVDVVALVSWDQLVQSHETAGSMLYWTLVGAYVVEASRNEVVTLVDTAVLHVPSRSLLFRAPGTDRQGGRSTAINAGRVQSSLARQGFELALADMTDNLDRAMTTFGQRVLSEGQVRLVDRRSGRDWHREHGGAGAGLALPILLVLWLLVNPVLPSVRREP